MRRTPSEIGVALRYKLFTLLIATAFTTYTALEEFPIFIDQHRQ